MRFLNRGMNYTDPSICEFTAHIEMTLNTQLSTVNSQQTAVNRQPKSRIFKSQQKTMKNQNAIGVGLALGAGLGVAIGAAVGAMMDDIALGVSLGIALGVGVGLAIGAVYSQMGGRDKEQ
jgi:hypothetical protein